jgi:stearoyl-CoA desaturase (delta-9 desaturase)
MRNFFKDVNWTGALFLTLTPPAALILNYFYLKNNGFQWQIWALAIVFYMATITSITAGYHRLFAHRTYQAKTWLRWVWALVGAASFQNSILIWAREHRVHHRFVDTDLDPYSIKKGFFFAHFGWMMKHNPLPINWDAYERDLLMDPVVRIQDKYYVPIAIFMGFVVPMLLGGLLGSFLGGLAVAATLRIVVVHHMTFFINSWCHWAGRQTYTDKNSAKDSFIMAVATFGEGYHNFHHYFANDYRNGVRWYHFDPGKWVIRFWSWTGAAYGLRRTPWSEIIVRQMEMDEKRLKSHLSHNWQEQFQAHLDNLKSQVAQAQMRFEQLREEYKTMAKAYAQSSRHRMQELRDQARQAKREFQAALEQWRAYKSFLLAASAV